MNNETKYQNVFMDVFGVDPEELTDAFTFSSVDAWDSYTHLTLISELEDAFDVMFESEDILHFGGYENGKAILARYGVEF